MFSNETTNERFSRGRSKHGKREKSGGSQASSQETSQNGIEKKGGGVLQNCLVMSCDNPSEIQRIMLDRKLQANTEKWL